jgi:hypothetical protein
MPEWMPEWMEEMRVLATHAHRPRSSYLGVRGPGKETAPAPFVPPPEEIRKKAPKDAPEDAPGRKSPRAAMARGNHPKGHHPWSNSPPWPAARVPKATTHGAAARRGRRSLQRPPSLVRRPAVAGGDVPNWNTLGTAPQRTIGSGLCSACPHRGRLPTLFTAKPPHPGSFDSSNLQRSPSKELKNLLARVVLSKNLPGEALLSTRPPRTKGSRTVFKDWVWLPRTRMKPFSKKVGYHARKTHHPRISVRPSL